MVKLVADRTGRFRQRPHYDQNELDAECERIVIQFLTKAKGRVEYPISTDDLTKLIETKADLDPYADLSEEGDDVEGITNFNLGKQPFVAISELLTQNGRRENRYRTTLSHEFGHVHFHDSIVQTKLSEADLFSSITQEKITCKRDRMTDAPAVDWMEWQACYASGAFLMPKTALIGLLGEFRRAAGLHSTICETSTEGAALIAKVKERFAVSTDAARVRLLKLEFLARGPKSPTLFD